MSPALKAAPSIAIPGLGPIAADSGLLPLDCLLRRPFLAGQDGVASVTATGDRKVEFIAFADHTLAYRQLGAGLSGLLSRASGGA